MSFSFISYALLLSISFPDSLMNVGSGIRTALSGPTVISPNERPNGLRTAADCEIRWNRTADGSLDRSWKWNRKCDLECGIYYICTHGQERQDSDYECAARDFQLSPNYVSNSYEIAEDFWEDGLGKGVAACLARSPHGGDAISKRFATEIHKGGPLSFGAGCAIRYMRYVLCAMWYMLYGIGGWCATHPKPTENIWKQLRQPALVTHSLPKTDFTLGKKLS